MLRGSLSALEGMPPPACPPVTPLPVMPDVVAPPVVAPPVVAGGVVGAPVSSAGFSSVLEQPAMAAKINAAMIHLRMKLSPVGKGSPQQRWKGHRGSGPQ